jgi:hypothetical protein
MRGDELGSLNVKIAIPQPCGFEDGSCKIDTRGIAREAWITSAACHASLRLEIRTTCGTGFLMERVESGSFFSIYEELVGRSS